MIDRYLFLLLYQSPIIILICPQHVFWERFNHRSWTVHLSGPQHWPTGPSQRRRSSLGNFLRGLLTVQSSRSKAIPIGRQYNYWPRRAPRRVSPRLVYRMRRLAYVLAARCVWSPFGIAISLADRYKGSHPVKRNATESDRPVDWCTGWLVIEILKWFYTKWQVITDALRAT